MNDVFQSILRRKRPNNATILDFPGSHPCVVGVVQRGSIAAILVKDVPFVIISV